MALTPNERRIRRDLRRLGLGRLQKTSKATTHRALSKEIAVVDKLIEDSQVGVLAALMEDRVTLAQLVDADRRQELKGAQVLANIALQEPVWDAMDRAITTMGRAKSTRQRYAVSRRALERHAGDWLAPTSRVRELAIVDWPALSSDWANSAADWNHVRRFVSRFLSTHLHAKQHPFRYEVINQIPIRPEPERVSQLTPKVFAALFEKSPDYLRAVWVTLLVTGMRVRSEYLRCTTTHLRPATTSIAVPGTKTAKSARVLSVPEELWPWIASAIPAPRQYKALREALVDLRGAVGVDDLRLHDFRHALGQWATDAGVDITKVQDVLGHTTLAMTARYTRQKGKGEVAGAVARVLKPLLTKAS